jgi:hypothetical protein
VIVRAEMEMRKVRVILWVPPLERALLPRWLRP